MLPRPRTTRRDRVTLIIAGLVAAGLLGAMPAWAAEETAVRDNVALFASGLGLTVATGLTFGIADVSYGVQGRWLPRGWAIAEVAAGGTLTLAGALLWAAIPLRGDARALYAVPASLSAWFIAHGVISLVLEQRSRGHAVDDRAWWFAVAPASGSGGGVLLGGSFH